MQKKSISIVAALMLSATSYSGTTQSAMQPLLNCNLPQVVIKHQKAYLNKLTPTVLSQVYLIKNTSKNTLLLDHTKADAGAGAGWASQLAPGNWSAIALSQKNFNLNCKTERNGKMQTVSCKALQICQPSAKGLTIHSNANYWVVEDKPWEELTNALRAKGVGL